MDADIPDGTNLTFHLSGMIADHRRNLERVGENRNAPDSPDLSPFILDDRGYLRFRVFISRQNLGWSGNSKIPDRLGFSRRMKTRLKDIITAPKKRNFNFFPLSVGISTA